MSLDFGFGFTDSRLVFGFRRAMKARMKSSRGFIRIFRRAVTLDFRRGHKSPPTIEVCRWIQRLRLLFIARRKIVTQAALEKKNMMYGNGQSRCCVLSTVTPSTSVSFVRAGIRMFALSNLRDCFHPPDDPLPAGFTVPSKARNISGEK